MTTTKHETLQAALVGAQRELADGLPHDGVVNAERMRYPYTSAEALIEAGRRALLAHGLALTAGDVRLRREATSGGEGGAWIATFVRDLVHEHGAASLRFVRDYPVVMGGKTPFNRTVNAANTYDLGYLLRDLLLVRRGDDPEADDSPESSAATLVPLPRPPPLAELDAERVARLRAIATQAGLRSADEARAYVARVVGRTVDGFKHLTSDEAEHVAAALAADAAKLTATAVVAPPRDGSELQHDPTTCAHTPDESGFCWRCGINPYTGEVRRAADAPVDGSPTATSLPAPTASAATTATAVASTARTSASDPKLRQRSELLLRELKTARVAAGWTDLPTWLTQLERWAGRPILGDAPGGGQGVRFELLDEPTISNIERELARWKKGVEA